MTATDPNLLVLAAYAGHWQITAYPDCRIVRCNCGHLAWLSPQGEPYFGRETVYTQCMTCHESERGNLTNQEVRAVPGSLQALRESHGDESVRIAEAFMRRHGITEMPDE